MHVSPVDQQQIHTHTHTHTHLLSVCLQPHCCFISEALHRIGGCGAYMLSYSTYISIQDTHISVLPRVKDILKLKSGPIPSLPPPASPVEASPT